MIVRFDLVCDRQAIADIDDAGIFAGPLQHRRTFRGQTPQMYTRTLVAAVLAPHHAEDAEFRHCRFPLQDADNLLIFAFREVVLREDVFSDHHYLVTSAFTMDSKINLPSALPRILS